MCRNRILFVLVLFALLTACMFPENEASLEVNRNFLNELGICTPQGRARINPQGRVTTNLSNAQSGSTGATPEQLIETANWAYREHILARRVASDCDVNQSEWVNLSLALKSVATDLYEEAGLSRREIRNIERRVSEDFII